MQQCVPYLTENKLKMWCHCFQDYKQYYCHTDTHPFFCSHSPLARTNTNALLGLCFCNTWATHLPPCVKENGITWKKRGTFLCGRDNSSMKKKNKGKKKTERKTKQTIKKMQTHAHTHKKNNNNNNKKIIVSCAIFGNHNKLKQPHYTLNVREAAGIS